MWSAKFFDGVRAESIPCRLEIKDRSVWILSKDGTQTLDSWPIEKIQYDPQHLDHRFLMVDYEPEARIELVDLQFTDHLPHLKKSVFENFLSSKHFIYTGLIFLIGFIAAIFFAANPTSRFIANKISPELEKSLAKKLNVDNYFTVCKDNFEIRELQSEVYNLLPNTSESIRNQISSFKVIQLEQENAFTVLGGQVYVSNKLINSAGSYDELIGILAHEMGHHHNRHVLQAIVRGSFLTLFLTVLTGDISQTMIVDPSTLANLVNLKFDRELEREADEFAVRVLTENDIGTDGLIRFFEKTPKIYSKIPEFLSTHPSDQSRIQFLSRYRRDTTSASTNSVIQENIRHFTCD